MNRSYLVAQEMLRLELKRKRSLIWGSILGGMAIFAIISGISDPYCELREHLPIYWAMLLPAAFLIYRFIVNKNLIESARRYDMVFMNDSDGFVSLDELTRQLGKDPTLILRELDALFRQGFFHSANLYLQGTAGVALANAEQSNSFVAVKCPSCSASSNVRVGSHAICPYCKSAFDTRS